MAKRAAKEKHIRKVVIIIVEGQSDENALSVALTEAFEQKYGEDTQVYFAKMLKDDGEFGGDITSKYGVIPEKIHMLMNKLIIMPCIYEHSLMPKYITEIVHIIDLDGAYIQDSQIVLDESLMQDESPKYCSEVILSDKPDKIRERNLHKRNNIEALLEFAREGFEIQNFTESMGHGSKPTTKKTCVPYSIFYFSCNLDHFIGGNANTDRFEKVKLADTFARQHGNDLQSLVVYLANDPDAIKGISIEESWNRIMEGTHSLKRSTNLFLLLSSIVGLSAD